MKRIAFIIGIAVLLSLTSCKKDWVCQCTDNTDSNSYHEVPNTTLYDANKTCNEYEFNNALGYNNCSLIN